MPLALSKINGDANPFVAVVLDGFHRPTANRDTLAEAFGNIDFAVAGPQLPGMPKNIAGQLVQRGKRMRKARFGRRYGVVSRHERKHLTWKAGIIAVPCHDTARPRTDQNRPT